MGEYADLYFRDEVMRKHGFDPGSMYDEKPKPKNACPKCGKRMNGPQGVKDHLRDKHKVTANSAPLQRLNKAAAIRARGES